MQASACLQFPTILTARGAVTCTALIRYKLYSDSITSLRCCGAWMLQAQFSLARVAVASQGNSVGTQEATQAAGASSGPAEPAVPVPSGATLPSSTTVSRTEALAELDCLPVQPYRVVTSFLNAGRTDIEGLGTEIHLMLQQGWGARLHPIWQQLVAVAGSKQLGGAPTDVSGARKAAPVSPTSPLEMDEELLRRGEPAPRSVTKTPSWIKLDDMGFVQKTVGHPDTSTVGWARVQGVCRHTTVPMVLQVLSWDWPAHTCLVVACGRFPRNRLLHHYLP